jgi:hypothetical protein
MKTAVGIIDVVDAGHPALLRMWVKRQRGYRAMGYWIVESGRFTHTPTMASALDLHRNAATSVCVRQPDGHAQSSRDDPPHYLDQRQDEGNDRGDEHKLIGRDGMENPFPDRPICARRQSPSVISDGFDGARPDCTQMTRLSQDGGAGTERPHLDSCLRLATHIP